MDLCRRPFAALIAYKGGHSALAQARIENRARCLALGPAQSWRAPGQPPGQNIANQQSKRASGGLQAPPARDASSPRVPRGTSAGQAPESGPAATVTGEAKSGRVVTTAAGARTGPEGSGAIADGIGEGRVGGDPASPRISLTDLLQGDVSPPRRTSPAVIPARARDRGWTRPRGSAAPRLGGVQKGIEAETTSPRCMREQAP